MKRVVIVHCWEGYPKYCWYPKTKEDLEKRGFVVSVPEMPETNFPKLSRWLPKLAETIGEPEGELYLVGHSLGVITILRYLESLELGQLIGGAVFVAGFTDDLGFKELENFFEDKVDFEKVKTHCRRFVAIQSDNDPYVDLKYGEVFKEKLGAKVIIKHNALHFSGPLDDKNSCLFLPEVVEEILEMTKEG